jgi:4-amino-4-deoxy-L-arabinose transferase-like glycosyltransferase
MMMARFPSPLILAWCALALILIVRGQAMWALGDRLDSDPDSYRELATGLQQGNGYALVIVSPFINTTAKAWRPPLYPCLLAAIIPRGTPNFSLWVGGVQLALGTLTVVAAYAASRQCGITRQAAAVAAGLVLLDPILIHQSAEVMTETLATFLVPICLIALVSAEQSAHRIRAPLLAGVALGAAILCRPTFLVWAVFVLGVLSSIDIFSRRFPGRALFFGLGVTIFVSPWAARNWAVLGKPIVTTTHGGYTFYRANNPLYYQHLRSRPLGTAWNSNEFDGHWRSQLAAELLSWEHGDRHEKVSSKDCETFQDTLAYEVGISAALSDPGMFVRASAVRLMRLFGCIPWQTDPNESPRTLWLRYGIGVFYFFEFALVLVGILALGRGLLAPPWLWGTLLVLAFTLVHTFYWTDMRMRAPLVPVVAMMAAVGVERVGQRVVAIRA